MCGTCGCSPATPAEAGTAANHGSSPGQNTDDALSTISGAETPATAGSSPRQVVLEQRLLAHNDQHAAANRQRFGKAGVQVVNLLSSPGSGKTSLLEALASAGLMGREEDNRGRNDRPLRQAALVGDLATDNDARRLRAAGLPALQINTGQGCHLEAAQVGHALDHLEAQRIPLAELDLLWIENVGNLVCPAAYDLGESLRVVLVSTTEGEDKPLKYAPLFHSADLVLISKVDLAEVVGFDRAAARDAIARVAPQARLLEVSARTGEGLAALAALLVATPAAAGARP